MGKGIVQVEHWVVCEHSSLLLIMVLHCMALFTQ